MVWSFFILCLILCILSFLKELRKCSNNVSTHTNVIKVPKIKTLIKTEISDGIWEDSGDEYNDKFDIILNQKKEKIDGKRCIFIFHTNCKDANYVLSNGIKSLVNKLNKGENK